MDKSIETLDDLKEILIKRWHAVEDMPRKYLSDSGFSAREVYRVVIWHLCFHDDIASVKDDEEFLGLIDIEGKDPEYYNVLKRVYKIIDVLSK